MISSRRRNVIDLSALAIGLMIGLILAALLLPLAKAEADAGPPVAALDAGPVDPVVAADHAIRSVAAPVDLPPAPSKGGTSVLDDALAIAGPVGRGALGGIACLAVAWLLARARDRWGWLRKGAAGNAAATVYAALATFGAVVAVGGSVGAGLTAVGSATSTAVAIPPRTATKSRLFPCTSCGRCWMTTDLDARTRRGSRAPLCGSRAMISRRLVPIWWTGR